MARQRLTTRRLVASPDAFSGQNYNSPVMLYDTHPNKRFVVGEDVIPISGGETRGMPIRGQVIGHSAEDRLWVKWPTEIAQEDVSDVVALREYEYGGTTRERLKGPQASRAASRQTQAGILDEFDDGGDGGGDEKTEEVQEVLFDSLPEDQDPEDDFDVEPEGSDEVTIIDMGSVCDDEYDQTSVIEEALQDSGLESDGSEMNDPFLTGSREAAFWDKPVYETKRLFDKGLQKSIRPGYHRFLLVVTQNQVAKVRAASPEDAAALTKKNGYKVKSKIVERTLENGKLTQAQYNALRKKNQQEGVKHKSYEITVQGPSKSAYIEARTEEEAKQSAASKGYVVLESRGAVDSKPGTMSETHGYEPAPKPAAIPGNPSGKPQYWGIKVLYEAPKQKTEEEIRSAPGSEDWWPGALEASRRTGAGPGASSLSSFEVVKALTHEEAIKKLKAKAAEEGKKIVGIGSISAWDQKKQQWTATDIQIPTRQQQAPTQQEYMSDWRVHGIDMATTKPTYKDYGGVTQSEAIMKAKKEGLKVMKVWDVSKGGWVKSPQLQQPGQSQIEPQLTPQTTPTRKRTRWRPGEGYGGQYETKQVASLEQHADLIRDTLGMTRTADLVRQAARVAQAVQETVQIDQDIDPVVEKAVRKATQGLLIAMNRLRCSNHRIGRRVASQIEQDFVDSLSFRIGA